MSKQEENIAAYKLLADQGWSITVPDGARCSGCKKPHRLALKERPKRAQLPEARVVR